ncbi:MAG TPA: MXAN_5187 C-terminal domain-containing protein, partial [Polyangiaceae bacterium LLY-WYZ-14_1]|nr:MXAN_5187 C-terminal domain-containing protein [Polyangiaceae bacterium LLY-WYZ-14_1]
AFGDGGGGRVPPSPRTPTGASPAGGGGDVVDDPEVAARLEAEDESTYYGRVYREYVAAKQALGEDVSNIPEERFVQRLRGNEAALAKKHGCRLVRFQVDTRGQQVVLKPVLIR